MARALMLSLAQRSPKPSLTSWATQHPERSRALGTGAGNKSPLAASAVVRPSLKTIPSPSKPSCDSWWEGILSMYFKTKQIHANFYHIGVISLWWHCSAIPHLPNPGCMGLARRTRDTSCTRETSKGLSHQGLLLFSV